MDMIWGVVAIFVITIISMVLHEIAHGYVAYWLGDSTAKYSGRLSLNPLKHIDPVMTIIVPVVLYLTGGPIFGGAKPVPINSRNLRFKEWGMALVGLAGPFTNLILTVLPKNVWLEVIYTENVVKGDTTSSVQKDAKLETGVVVKVPAFIKTGDVISVDTESYAYRERKK